MPGEFSPLTISHLEAAEIRELLPIVDAPRRADQHMARARLRRIGYPLGDAPSDADFNALIESGEVVVDETGRARIQPKSGRIFRCSVGVRGRPVDPTWSAFDQRFQWFGDAPQSISSGDHLFIFAVDFWRSAVVGLFETVSAGAQRLLGSPDVERWPWALGVRPLAAIPPPQAEQVPGQQGPRNPTPVYVYDEDAWPQLYAAVADSPPPPGPNTVEQRVQEVEWTDLGDDVVQAVFELGTGALWADVFARTIEIGEWTEKELAARAWYTGGDESSHIKATVGQAIRLEQNMTGRIGRNYGSGPFRLRIDYQPPASGFGATYRPADDRTPTQSDEAPHRFDLDKLERATARHMKLQDLLAGRLRQRGIEPRSPAPSQPMFDLAFGHAGKRFVVEVKSGLPVTTQQVRLGIGQVLEYAHLLREPETDAMPILLLEGRPPPPWPELMDHLGVRIMVADDIDGGIDQLVP